MIKIVILIVEVKVFHPFDLRIENLKTAAYKNRSNDLTLIHSRMKYFSSLIDIIMSVLMIHKKSYVVVIIMTTFDQEKDITMQDYKNT